MDRSSKKQLPSQEFVDIKTVDIPQWTVLWIRDGQISSISQAELQEKISRYDTVSLDTETTGDFNDLYDRKIVMLQLGTDKEQFV